MQCPDRATSPDNDQASPSRVIHVRDGFRLAPNTPPSGLLISAELAEIRAIGHLHGDTRIALVERPAEPAAISSIEDRCSYFHAANASLASSHHRQSHTDIGAKAREITDTPKQFPSQPHRDEIVSTISFVGTMANKPPTQHDDDSWDGKGKIDQGSGIAKDRGRPQGSSLCPTSTCYTTPTAAAADPRWASRGPTAGRLKRRQTSAKRCARYLTIDQALELIVAFQQAESADTPLNAHITMTFDGSGTSRDDVARAGMLQRELLITIRKLLEQRLHSTSYIWVLETGETGLHLHVLLHIAPERWVEIKSALTQTLRRRLDALDVKPRLEQVAGKPWSILSITPAQEAGGADKPAGIEDRLRLLGYLLKGIDPAALVETRSGCVPFADLLRFYLGNDVKPQGAIIGAKRVGRSESLPTRRLERRLDPLAWIGSINRLRDERLKLPGPEFLATRLGPGSPDPDWRGQHLRAVEVEELRYQCRREQQIRWRENILAKVFMKPANRSSHGSMSPSMSVSIDPWLLAGMSGDLPRTSAAAERAAMAFVLAGPG